MRGYGVASLALIGAYPLLPATWRAVDFLVVCASAIPCVLFGRRALHPDQRRPWTLLIASLAAIIGANLVWQVPGEGANVAGWLIDAGGNVLAFVAALTLIAQRGRADLGGIIDTGVIALAFGGMLWVALPHQLGPDRSFAAQVNLFVVVFALTGVLGALLRLSNSLTGGRRAVYWLLGALGAAIASTSIFAVAGDGPALLVVAEILFMVAFAALGLFGLDPTAPEMTSTEISPGTERLSVGRLVLLGLAVAVVPVVVGIRDLLGWEVNGLLLAVQGALVAGLVMVRIGMLSAQRARAEQALVYQAAHDPLTNLPNRRTLIGALTAELARGRRCMLVFCDLDNFKAINDRYGHAVGDQLLIEVADRIQSCVSRPHMVSRFGGDEFVILLVDPTNTEAHATCQCVADALAHPFDQARDATVGVSIGLAGSDGRLDPDQLIKAADRAMYQEKAVRRRDRAR